MGPVSSGFSIEVGGVISSWKGEGEPILGGRGRGKVDREVDREVEGLERGALVSVMGLAVKCSSCFTTA